MSLNALRSILLIAVLALNAACSSIPSISGSKRGQALEASVETYRKTLRWGYYDEAARYVRAQDGSDPRIDLDRMARYRITRLEVSDKLLADTGTEARVIAYIEYYEIDSGVIKTLRDEQYWWYDGEDERWYLGSNLPAFGLE